MSRLTIAFIAVVIVVFALDARGQTARTYTVTGHVADEGGGAVEGATVMLLNAADSTSVTSSMTDEAGRYTLRAVSGHDYLVKIAFVGYETMISPLGNPKGKDLMDLGTSVIRLDSHLIDEAVVVAEAPPVMMRGDTVTYSAAAIRLHDGAMLEDLLKKIPGAEISADGKITVNGKEISKIMIDGKEFFVNDPDMALKNLPADVVKDVKTYDRKSDMARTTGIDDGEEQNVLDVTIKDGMKKGWFGNAMAGAGTEEKYEASAMVNRFRGDMQFTLLGSANNTNGRGGRNADDADIGTSGMTGYGETRSQSLGANFSIDKTKVDFHADVSYGRRDHGIERNELKETFLVHGSTLDSRHSTTDNLSNRLNGSLSLTWDIDSMTSLRINQNFDYGMSDNGSYSMSHTLDFMSDTINAGVSSTGNDGHNYSLRGNLMLNRRLGKDGRNVTLRASYDISDGGSDELSLSHLYFYAADSLSDIRRLTANSSRDTRYQVSLTYSEPLWKDAYLRLGYSYSKSLSSSLRDPVYDNSPAVVAGAFENETYNYKSEHSIEASLQSTWRKLYYNIGLDFLPLATRTKVDRGINSGLDKEQATLAFQPRANIVIRFDKTRQLRLYYSGRSSTPSILDLQEVKDISDPMNLKLGNPNLKNSFRNMASISFTGFDPGRGSSLFFMLSANNVINGITQRTTFDGRTGVRTTRSENINGNWGANTSLAFISPLKNKKFTLSATVACHYSHRVGYSSMSGDDGASAVSISNNAVIDNSFSASYRCDRFDATLGAVFETNLSRNNLNSRNDRSTYGYGLNANVNITLPWELYFSTSASYVGRRGYSAGYDDDYVLWNVQLSKSFLKGNRATVRIKAYDILHSQNNTFRTMGYDYTLDTETNVVGSYLMVQFVYRFNTMGAGRKSDRSPSGDWRRRPMRGVMRAMPMGMPT